MYVLCTYYMTGTIHDHCSFVFILVSSLPGLSTRGSLTDAFCFSQFGKRRNCEFAKLSLRLTLLCQDPGSWGPNNSEHLRRFSSVNASNSFLQFLYVCYIKVTYWHTNKMNDQRVILRLLGKHRRRRWLWASFLPDKRNSVCCREKWRRNRGQRRQTRRRNYGC